MNQGDADFLYFMKVNKYIHYVNDKSSHIWTILNTEMWQNPIFTIVNT